MLWSPICPKGGITLSDKYDLSSIAAVSNSAKLARAAADGEPSQDSYNAAWLHGYADALADVARQMEPQKMLGDPVPSGVGEPSERYAAMSQEDFQACIMDLLGEADPAATGKWLQYTEELDQAGTKPQSAFFDELCGELQLIKGKYGLEIARQLYQSGQTFTFAPFELRGAAEYLKAGTPISEVIDLAKEGDFFTVPEHYHRPETAISQGSSSPQKKGGKTGHER